MGWKCTPQLTGLVRGEPKKGAKHRSNIKAICAEAGKERITSSQTIDRSRSHLNRYKGIESGFACADDMTGRANEYKQQVKGKGGSVMQRRLRNDAVIGCAIIYNPPEDVCRNWTDEQYAKFYKDSDDFMHEVCPAIFREENVVMDAEHFDEGTIEDPEAFSRHRHRILNCIDEDGRYCGNLIDAHLLDTINRQYPTFMRSRGWEMDDLDVTDWDKAKSDKEYRLERNAKREKSGRAVNDYLSQKLNKQVENADNTLEQINVLKNDAERRLRYANSIQKKADERETALDNREKALAERESKISARERSLEAREEFFRGKVKDFAERQKKWQEKASTASREVSEQKRQLQTEIDTFRQKSTTLDSMIHKLREEKTEDEIQETVLERCVYLWRDSEKKVHRLPAREYAQQMRRRREQALQGIERDLPQIRQGVDHADEFHL